MPDITPGLLDQIRGRFAHVDSCPFQGPRIFFENAGGALTLRRVAEISGEMAAIPDNQGRDNPASHALMRMIAEGREAMRQFLNAPDGQVFVGESGTELLFRLIRTACFSAAPGGIVISSTLEHPASRSAAARWAEETGRPHVLVPHDDATGTVTADAYRAHLTPDVRVATIIHTSPVTGIGVDMPAIAAAIRAVAPDCLIVVDGIQHAAHGGIDIAAAGIDGYAISPYKVFSRHGYGVAWASDRLTAGRRETLDGGPATNWEFGTRDTAAYVTWSEVVRYFDWLGAQVSDADTPRGRIEAAGKAIKAHEARLTQAMLHGTGNLRGVAEMPGVTVIGGLENPGREGLVSLWVEGVPSEQVVARLNAQGIRTHTRKADHYSGNILDPLGRSDCIRVSLCHYNTEGEVAQFLAALDTIATEAAG